MSHLQGNVGESISTIPNGVFPRLLLTTLLLTGSVCSASESDSTELEAGFATTIAPFLKSYCLDCHGQQVQEAKLSLSEYTSAATVSRAHQTWKIILDRLEAGEMPPEDADRQPDGQQRQAVIDWIHAARQHEAQRNAGDPGPVLARRLSNAEYNYSIRDLTGVDIRPTKSFPVDPANEAGFDNTGESLTMSPALLGKYLGAARQVVEHLVLKPDGIAFAPHPVVTDTDRDKYCVKRIVEFYYRQPTDLADYFFAAWQHQHTGTVDHSLAQSATAAGVSPKYLATIWQLLHDTDAMSSVGPVAAVQAQWRQLLADSVNDNEARAACEQMRKYVRQLRDRLRPQFPNIKVEGSHFGSQPFVLWKNRQYVAHRREFDRSRLRVSDGTETDKTDDVLVVPAGEGQLARYEASFARFCSVFPDAFYIAERGRDYVESSKKQMGERGRLLSAGFHSMMGYFRDDAPLYDMILDEAGQQELDDLWRELDFIALAPQRQYVGFLWFERTDSRYMREPQFDFARPENKASQSAAMIKQLASVYLDKAKRSGGGDVEINAIRHYFRTINEQIRWVEQARNKAEQSHISAVLTFADRACRRTLSKSERDDLRNYYRSLRNVDGLSHEEAIQDTIVSVLMSPHFCYRVDLAGAGSGQRPLTGDELASRLSYFLWSSTPDQELLRLAASGELTKPEVLLAQTRRLLQNGRIRGLATEFAGHWLDFRRFEQHNSVDRQRFPAFTDELRQAMFEEPVRFFVDVVRQNRSVFTFLDGRHTFVNDVLAEHYGIPRNQRRGIPRTTIASSTEDVSQADPRIWVRLDHADRFGRGGLMPMSVFLTMNAPGLRTSPVKRGYWVVRRLLGERIPPPPPNVPDLPEDEAGLGDETLREALARHRDNKSCAGCHERFDSIGLAFESFGPIGERRSRDLGGRPVSTAATFPGGHAGDGLKDLQLYLRMHRQNEYLDNLCRKLLSYALGRSLILSDDQLIRGMRTKLESDGFRFQSLIESIVASPQFLNKRGSDHIVRN